MNIPKLPNVPGLEELRREVYRLFENYVGSTPGELIGLRKHPLVDIWEEGDCLVIQAEVPGTALDQIEVYARGSELTVKGFRPAASVGSSVVHRQERQAGPFERTIQLPVKIDAERIEAAMKDGLLTIRVPRPPLSQARRVAIRTGQAENSPTG
ncbi:MAG TPA: Hsp20/alpha crystallin family protein [Phycisphaerae bacterium]|nr:Hsp20/alpha crystallin family protein [Phycisphaerae bacterium]